MNLKRRILALTAGAALLGGIAVAATPVSSRAGTPSCGHTCVNTYPAEYAGQSLGDPQFVVDVLRQGEKVGQPIILFRSSNADPAEDWVITDQGTVADFYAAGLVSASVALHYGCTVTVTAALQQPCGTGPGSGVNDTAWQLEYSPYGVDSGLCMGVAATPGQGTPVTLQECGVSGKTVWIEDTYANDDSSVTLDGVPFWAAINGAETNFSNPYVLTYPGDAYPTDKPRAELTTDQLAQFSNGTPNDDDNQLFTGVDGVLP